MINRTSIAFRHGNLLTLAVAVLLGAAVWGLVNGITQSLVLPLIAAALDKPEPLDLMSRIGDTPVRYTFVLTGVINLLLIAVPVSLLIAHLGATSFDCPYCRSQMPLEASVCAACGRDVPLDLEADEGD